MKERIKNLTIKLMPKAQSPLIAAAFALSAVFFFYSLSFSTEIFPLSQLSDPESFYVSGAEMYHSAQSFNSVIFYFSIVLVLASLAPRLFFTHRRRVFYKSNYITTGIFALLAFIGAIFNMVGVIVLRAAYLKIDFEDYKQKAEIVNARYIKSTLFFDLGIVVSLLLLVLCAGLVWLMVYKRGIKAVDPKVLESINAKNTEGEDEPKA